MIVSIGCCSNAGIRSLLRKDGENRELISRHPPSLLNHPKYSNTCSVGIENICSCRQSCHLCMLFVGERSSSKDSEMNVSVGNLFCMGTKRQAPCVQLELDLFLFLLRLLCVRLVLLLSSVTQNLTYLSPVTSCSVLRRLLAAASRFNEQIFPIDAAHRWSYVRLGCTDHSQTGPDTSALAAHVC